MKTRSGSSLLVLKKCILILVQIVRWTVFRTVTIGVGTTAVGFCSKERLGLTQDTTKKSRDLQPKNRVGGGSQWMKNYDESMVILAKLT